MRGGGFLVYPTGKAANAGGFRGWVDGRRPGNTGRWFRGRRVVPRVGLQSVRVIAVCSDCIVLSVQGARRARVYPGVRERSGWGV